VNLDVEPFLEELLGFLERRDQDVERRHVEKIVVLREIHKMLEDRLTFLAIAASKVAGT